MPSFAFVALFAFVGWSYALTLLYPTSLLAGATYSVQWSGQPSFLFTVEQFHPNKTLQSIITDNNITYLQIDVPAGTQIGFVIEDSITPSLASDILTVQPNPLLSASISLASLSLLASTTSTLSTASPVSSNTATTTKPSGSESPTTSPTQNTHRNHTVAIVVGCVIGGLFLISFVFRCCSGGGGDFSFGLDVNV